MPATALTIDPRRAALLILDYQNGILGAVDGAGELLSRARHAIELLQAHVLDTADLEQLLAVPE